MRWLSAFALIPLLLLAVPEAIAQESFDFLVRGRVIDEMGKPVANASICLLPPKPCGDGFDCVIECHRAGEDGRFEIKGTFLSDKPVWDLFLLEPHLRGRIKYVLYPPFPKLLMETDQRFAGRQVRLMQNRAVEMGDVPLQVRYGVVRLKPANEIAWAAFFDRLACPRDAWLKVCNARGDVIHFGSFGCIDQRDERVLSFALPAGVWQIGVEIEGKDRTLTGTNGTIIVSASGEPLEIELKAKVSDAASSTAAADLTAAESLELLKGMGFNFETEVFIDRVRNRNARAVAHFLAAGMSPKAQDQNGIPAIIYAATTGDLSILQLLISKGADVNAKDGEGATALMAAAAHFNGAAVEMLIKSGADINARHKNGMTALIMAAGNGQLRNVELLLAAGVDVNTRDEEGYTALGEALKLGRKDIAALLKKAGAKEK